MGWLSARSKRIMPVAAMVAGLALVAGTMRPAWGQTLVTIQNSKLAASVGQEDDLNSVNVAGRFGIVEAGQSGGVLLQLPRSTDLGQIGSYVTVRIDGGTPFLADGTVAEGVPGWDIAWGYEDTEDTDITGEWVQVPTVVSPTVIVAKWRTIPDAEADPAIPEIQVDLKMRLVYDMVLYTFTVTNKDTRPHTVGLRFAQDFAVPQSVDGPVMTSRTGMIRTETSLISTFIPAYWRAAAAQSPSTVGASLLPSGSSPYPTRPDRLVFGLTKNVAGSIWDFTPTAGEEFVGDLLDGSAAVYYNPVQYAPGQKRDVTMVFGAAGAAYEFGQRLAAGLEGPPSLTYDPSQPADKQLQPNPMAITAFVHNMNTVAIGNVRAVLSLPEGLKLAAGQTSLKTVATIGADGEATFKWDVVPTGTISGRLTYSVAISADPGGQGISVARDIDIPALPSQEFGAGWQMVSFPYVLDDRTPAGAIQLGSGFYDLVRWNAAAGHYQAVQYINPGEGYWLRLSNNSTLTLNDPQPVQTPTGDFSVKLARGWNQVANPYLLRVRWADVRVINTDATDPDYLVPLSVQDAASVTRQWISSAIFRYNPATGSYEFDQDYATDLLPVAGYWVKANKPNLELLITKPTGRAAQIAAWSRSVAPSGGWRLRLKASDGVTSDACNFIGIGPDALDGSDVRDVAKPPAPAESVSMAIVREETGGRAEAYAQDMRSPAGGAKTWRLAVTSREPNTDVTITWPEIGTLPKTHELYIADDAGSPRRAMRQASSITINTGPTGTRSLTITAEPRSAGGAFRITSWNVTPSRSRSTATIAVAATQSAALTVRVLGPTGTAVRRLTSRATSGTELAQIIWDMRDSKGVAVPAGTYTVEIKAVSGDGQTARVVAPLVVTR
ncbi:MAG: hypothetical protein GX446_01735 [Chthonomonadales bacterium]|nr:hypothetical protein [Chthonomonadales bacterium]